MRWNKVIAVASTLALLFTAACGDDGGSNASNEANNTSEQQPETPDAEALKKDVKIVSCEGASGLTATLEVTNSLDEPKEYYGTIDFLDGSGTQVTDGVFNTGTLQPGEKSTEEIPGANVYEAVPEVTCEVAEVKLDDPE